MKVSVIIPVLNEENAVGLVIAEIPRENVQEIIVVDNGSTDRTRAVAEKGGALVLAEPQKGYGRAVLRGLSQLSSDCDTVVILDGDHSDFPEELPKLLDPILKNEADLVVGSRSHAAFPGSLTPLQRFGNWLTCVFLKMLFGQIFTDLGPFRAIRRSTLDALQMEDPTFGWNVEMQIKALRQGFRVKEVSVRYRPRIGQSKISGTFKGSVQAGIKILWSIYKLGISRSSSPRKCPDGYPSSGGRE